MGDRFLEQYGGQSTDQLIAMENEYRIDSLVLAFEQAIDQKAYDHGMDALSDEEAVVLAIEALEREVNNGGYMLFFTNSSVEYAPMILHALGRIDCPYTQSVTERAIEALAIDGPLTVENIEEVIAESDPDVRDELAKCDDLYFQGQEDIAGRLFEFIRNNRSGIRIP
ncbi:MAG: hypothetical protein AMXMBFR84_18610 [Candidatus Hydrogenedentota bacterium]